MSEHEFTMLKIERIDGADEYRLHGLPAGADFRSADSYVELTATWLKVDGHGFAAPQAEFSEHGETITVDQETDGGSAHIRLS